MDDVALLLLAVLAAAAALAPALRAARAPAPDGAADWRDDDAALEREIARYRAALRAGTLCPRCRFPNPDASRHCADCGRRLAPAGPAAATGIRPAAGPGTPPAPGAGAPTSPAP